MPHTLSTPSTDIAQYQHHLQIAHTLHTIYRYRTLSTDSIHPPHYPHMLHTLYTEAALYCQSENISVEKYLTNVVIC